MGQVLLITASPTQALPHPVQERTNLVQSDSGDDDQEEPREPVGRVLLLLVLYSTGGC